MRTVRDAADRLFLFLHRPPLHVSAHGIELRGYLRHRSFLADVPSKHEPYLRELLLAELRPDTLFVDVGAHVGLYTLLAAPRVAKVVAFEADPYNRAALVANVRRAKLDNVRIVGKAASDCAGRSRSGRASGTYASSLTERRGFGAGRRIEIEATTVDAEVEPADDLVAKIDVEGAETAVLEGLRTTLAGSRRAVLLVELNRNAIADAGRTPEDLTAKIRELGLEAWLVDDVHRRLVPIDEVDLDTKGNLYCRSVPSAL